MATFWPSTNPASVKPCRNASTRCAEAGGRSAAKETHHRQRWLLRARRQRPRSRTPDERDELAPLHLMTPSPRTMPSIAGRSRASQQKRPPYVRFGSIAPDRYDRDARPMSASPPIAVKHWHRSEPPLRAISCREQSSNIRLQKPDLLDHLVGAQQD